MKAAACVALLALIWVLAVVFMGVAARVMWSLLQIGWNVL